MFNSCLYWGQAILIPIALAILITCLLGRPALVCTAALPPGGAAHGK